MKAKVKFEIEFEGEPGTLEIETYLETSMDQTHFDEMSSEERNEYISDILWEKTRTYIVSID